MKTLGSIVTYKKGKPPKTGPHGRLPVLSPYYLRTGRIEEMAEPTTKDVVLKGGELILLWDGSNAGEFFRARAGILSSTMVVFEFDQKETDPDYLYYDLKRFEPELKGLTAGSGIPHVDKEVLLAREVFEGVLEEQKAAAKVLLKVDRAIEQTNAFLAKQQRIKSGLIHDLLTRGLDSQGKLRDPSTHKFKPSPLGPIPEEWSIGTLLDAADLGRQPILTGPFGADLGINDFVADGVPVLRIGNVQQGILDLSDLLYVTPRKAAELARYSIRAGDLLFARQGATTGRNALASDAVNGWLINYHIIRVALDHGRCSPMFIEATFNSESVRCQVDREKGRGTREGINTAQLKAIQLKLTPVAEQREIAKVLCALVSRHDVIAEFLDKLRRLKTGLMDDLLTGRVPVTPMLSSPRTMVTP